MDRHLSYVGMTRHREEAKLYAGNDDFRDFEALRERLSRARPTDTTLDYAQRRGFEVAEPIRG
jgi:ATP-dependent exoDNAse (exonuclease V) alpha subunit